MKSPAMLPSRKGPISNQDGTIKITQQDPILSPFVAKWLTGYIKKINDTYV